MGLAGTKEPLDVQHMINRYQREVCMRVKGAAGAAGTGGFNKSLRKG